MTLQEITLTIVTLGFAVLIVFVFLLLVDMRKTLQTFREVLGNVNDNLNPALKELTDTLESFRRVTDDVGSVTGNVREVSESLSHVTKSVRRVTGYVDDIGVSTTAKIFALRAGVKTGFSVFLKRLFRK